jgi:hypothetical protein
VVAEQLTGLPVGGREENRRTDRDAHHGQQKHADRQR